MELVERYLPGLLITDIKMPVLGGLELIQRLRRTNPDLRILIVSGYSEFEYAKRAIELGVDDYLVKPIDGLAFQETLRRIRIRLEASAGAIDSEFGLDRNGSREEELANAVELYLKENYRLPYSLERLAATFGCKAAYLLRLYRQIKGFTPTQDLIRLRIEKAKRLLVGHPQMEIKQVAVGGGLRGCAVLLPTVQKGNGGKNPSAFRDSMARP